MDIEKEAEKLVMKKTENKKTGMGDKGKNLDPKLCPEREEKFVGFKNEDETEMAELRREFIEIRMNIQESSIKLKLKTVDPKLEAKAKQFDKMIEEDEIDQDDGVEKECKPKPGIKRIVRGYMNNLSCEPKIFFPLSSLGLESILSVPLLMPGVTQ